MDRVGPRCRVKDLSQKDTRAYKGGRTKMADPELEPPADLVMSRGFNAGPMSLVKLLPLRHIFSHAAFPLMVPP